MSPYGMVVTLCFGLGLVGCATPRGPASGRSASIARAIPQPLTEIDASGTWDWNLRSRDEQGDWRVEQEEWHLTQHGSQIDGHYDRVVTMLSVDERLFKCNQKLGFHKVTRVHLAGQIEDGHIRLREVGFEAKAGPCDDGARNLVEYRGELRGGTLVLSWAPGAGQTLTRRSEAGRTPLVAFVSDASSGTPTEATQPAPAASAMTVSVPVGGTWEWELRSIDAEGDERLEREEWHLDENADGIEGYYDRTVRRVRGDGIFTCNGEARIETATRYRVKGQRFGEKVMLTEVDYQAERTTCDNALRRLDSYQGHVADPDSLVLSWGTGNQLLHRKR